MNSQYLQQNPYYGAQQPNLPYGEPNANLPPKGPLETQSYPPQKPLGSAPPSSRPYDNVSTSQPPPPQSNQNNLIDQMSNISLSGQQKPPSQNNLINNPPGSANGLGSPNPPVSQGPPQQRPPISQSSNIPPQGMSRPPQAPVQQYTGPPSNPGSGSSATTNMAQNPPKPNQNQNSSAPNFPNSVPQQNFVGSPLSSTQPPPHMGGPTPPRQAPSMPPLPASQNASSPLIANQNPQGPPSMMGQQNMSRPPNNMNGPPLSGQPSLSGPTFNQPPNVHNFSGPPMSGQPSYSRPPLPGQQPLLGPSQMGQQGPPPQGPYPNQPPNQGQYLSGPPLPGQQSNLPYGMNQGLQQPNYGPGQPPMFGQQASPYQAGFQGGPGSYPPNPQAQQNKRLDPDQMPSPIQVFQDDQRLRGGDFITNQKGLVPPLVTSKFVVHDQGNSSPRFIRSSMYTVPTSADMMKNTQIPFSIILNPMVQVEEGELEPPIVNLGEIGPIRCVRCKAYMCPFMQFVDAGRRFQCVFCKATTEVPQEYFQHLDHTGQRMDRYERPELMLGTYEYVATKDYCKNNEYPKPPAIIFVIDVSYSNVKSGLLHLLCSQMKQIIRNLPVDVGQEKSNMKIGFITYSTSIHFYNCKANLAQPQMMYVGDVEEVFMPLLEGFLCDAEESESTIDSLMTQIPTMFGDNRETETILGPAIQAGLEALKASECAGKLMVFHSTLPLAEAPGKLKKRDDRNLLGTDKEKTVLAPQTNYYNNLGQECVGAGCSVDLFLFNNSYIDVATIGQVSRLTGGEIYKYTYFQADLDGERLITDIINNISRPIAFDAVMRVRTSTGVRPTDFYGHLYMSNTTDMEIASIDCDKAIAIEIKHDDKLAEEEGVYVQAALLYTSCGGVRRLRVINLSLKTSSQMTELYRSCDLDAIINFILKQSVSKLVELSQKAIKDALNAKCAAILAAYRKYCASPSNAGQLILPDCMKLLPLYINSLLKSEAIVGGAGITVDQKSYVMMAVSSMPITETVAHIYPRLISLHDVDPASTELPPMLRCSIDKFQDNGVYLLENGIHMFMWFGLNLNPQWVQAVFGVASVVQIDTDKTTIPVLDNSLNKRIRDIVGQVQSERRFSMRLTLTRQREKMEMVLRQFLVEDRGVDGSPSYVDYLCHMHREIRTLLS